jgi:hypothetical protein
MNEHPKPPFPTQQQPMPGATQAMDPRPDHGENSYKGSLKLKGLKAVITGADSELLILLVRKNQMLRLTAPTARRRLSVPWGKRARRGVA